MYLATSKTDDQCKLNARSRAPKASALGQSRGIGWGGRWEGGSGWGDTCIPVAYSCWCMSIIITISSVHSLSHVLLCDPMNCSTPGPPVHHQPPEFTQTHVHRVGDAIQPSHPLLSPSPPSPLSYPLPMIFICNLVILRILYQWNCIVCNLLRLAVSTQHDSFSSVQIVAYIDNLFILIAAWYSMV